MRGEQTIQRRPGLPDEVARRIRDDITAGRLKAGDRLPSEHEMSDAYGVSRPVVREAISQLKYDGLLVSQQGRGIFVSEEGRTKALRMDFESIHDAAELAHMIELLVAVEGAATGLAAARRTRADLRTLAGHLKAMQRAIDEGETGVEMDVEFHRTIVAMTRNPYFIQLSQFLDDQVRNFIRRARTNTARFQGLALDVQREHEEIYAAVEKGDPAEARGAAERHLRNAGRRLNLYTTEEAPPPPAPPRRRKAAAPTSDKTGDNAGDRDTSKG